MNRDPAGYSAALYMRLSKDDDCPGESSSITSQRSILTAYAREHGYRICEEYVDDGFSGTNFDRPAFLRLIRDIERRKINMVLTKDLSRLGRDYIQTGRYTEIYFPSKNVRFIAVNDGFDSENPYTDIAPFKHVVNEMYARDASRKIKSAIASKMAQGAYIGNFPPYGYKKNPGDKSRLIPDEAAAAVVRRIFSLAADGLRPTDIASILDRDGIMTPLQYRYANLPAGQYLGSRIPSASGWSSNTISKLLKNEVYLGHTLQGKTAKISFKSKKLRYNPQEDWVIVRNTHEPLVEQRLFDLAGRRRRDRLCPPCHGFFNIFSGISRCADCGAGMSTVGTGKKTSRAVLACGAYKQCGKKACSNHFIDYSDLLDIVLSEIRRHTALSPSQAGQLSSWYRELRQLSHSGKLPDCAFPDLSACQLSLEQIRQRDRIILKLYEDNAAGLLDDDRFHRLLASVGGRERNIRAHPQPPGPARPELFPDAIEELTPRLLFLLIDKIEIGQGHFEQGEHGKIKFQKVSITFRFQI